MYARLRQPTSPCNSCWYKRYIKNQRLEQIANSVVELALSVKSNSFDVTLSAITVRSDGHQRKVV